MNYHLFVTGCQQNVYDAEKITHLIEKMGYFESDEKNADVIIAVACAVRQKPMDRIFGKLKIWNKLPQKPKIIIVGCVLPADKKKLIDKVDSITSVDKFNTTLNKITHNYLLKKRHGVKRVSKINNISDGENRNIFVPIMYGCNNFCSYCAVPYTRGREVSRPEIAIIDEVKNKVKDGAKEIMLLGQNVNSYQDIASLEIKSGSQAHRKDASAIAPIKRTSFNDKLASYDNNFVNLLKKIETIKYLEKISFMTSHPKDMSDDLIDWMAKSKKFSRELHLPVQSGDDDVLRKMNRHYTADRYVDLTSKLRTQISNLKLSTDIIVGFPGESEKQFQNTYNLCKKINFDKAYISQYSPRPGTIAAKMNDDVSRAEKKRRWEVLEKLINKKG